MLIAIFYEKLFTKYCPKTRKTAKSIYKPISTSPISKCLITTITKTNKNIREPPPNLTVPWTSLSFKPSPSLFHTHRFPSDPKQLNFVSSVHTIFYQSSTVQCWWASAQSMRILLCFLERNGRFRFITAFIPTPQSALCTVFIVKDVLVISCKVLVASVALSAF